MRKNAVGVFDVLSKGYPAISTRKNIAENNEEQYLERMEKSIDGDFEITEYELLKERSDEESILFLFGFLKKILF